MDKNNILGIITSKLNRDKMTDEELENEELLKEVEYTLVEIETARNIFNTVEDPNLIDVAIYSEEIAKRRLAYLISIAKARHLSVTDQYIVDKFLEVAE